jgi:transaldolase
MGEGSFYDDDIARLARQGLDARTIFEALALDDIRAAAREMEPVWERTAGLDGRISFEVPPDIADDTEATTSETRRLFDELARPNVFIKIPATAAGVPAIRASIAAGINVNVTLIFSIARYREVIEAYLSGLEELAEAGGDLVEVASVASFFVSRVDTLVDKELQALVDKGGPEAEAARARLVTAAIDNAKLAYEVFEQAFQGPRWQELAREGARVQRPLWASTSTKNPAYRDVVYVEELIGPDTVNTLPEVTIAAFEDHGTVARTIDDGVDDAGAVMRALAEVGVDMDDVGRTLEDQGVASFHQSFAHVLQALETKARQLAPR